MFIRFWYYFFVIILLIITNLVIIIINKNMRKKPSSPYAELIEANKKILQEDGKYLDYSNIPKPYT